MKRNHFPLALSLLALLALDCELPQAWADPCGMVPPMSFPLAGAPAAAPAAVLAAAPAAAAPPADDKKAFNRPIVGTIPPCINAMDVSISAFSRLENNTIVNPELITPGAEFNGCWRLRQGKLFDESLTWMREILNQLPLHKAWQRQAKLGFRAARGVPYMYEYVILLLAR